MQLRFGRPRHDSQQSRDLFVAVAFDVVQHEHLPCALGKPLDRFLEIDPQLERDVPRGQLLQRVGGGITPAALGRHALALAQHDVIAKRCSHVPNAASPRNVPSFSQARTKISCVTSSATSASIMRRTRLWIRAAWARYSRSNARPSPVAASSASTASASALAWAWCFLTIPSLGTPLFIH